MLKYLVLFVKEKIMISEELIKYFSKYNLQNRIIELPTSTATVELAAKSLNCTNGEIAKSLTFKLDDKIIMILMAGDYKIDNSKYKKEFNKKAKMLSVDEVKQYIGYNVGGVCPFNINDNIDVFLDNSLKKYEIVYPACGTSNSAVKLHINELEETSKAIKWIDVTKQIV